VSHPLRVLSLSTLFPCQQRPSFGGFVANQMKAVAALAGSGEAGSRGGVDLVMINPIGIPIWPFSTRNPYRTLALCPPASELGGITVHHPRFATIPRLGADSNPARIARAVLPLARRLHAERPFDVVDAQFYFPDGPAAQLIAAALGVSFTVKARGSDIHYWSTRPRALRQILECGAAAARQLSVSAALGRDMVALGLPEISLRVHYTGLDRARFHVRPRGEARTEIASRLNLALPDGAPLLVCPGALIAIKGQDIAISALAGLPRAHLVLAGAGPDEAALRTRARQPDVAGRVHLLGQVSHDLLPLLMAAADAVVLPSEREGLANVWIEALACGTPLVIPDIGGAREVVRNPSTGRIAAREPGAIAAAIADLLSAPPTQAEVAANVEQFSWEENAKALVACWREVVEGRG